MTRALRNAGWVDRMAHGFSRGGRERAFDSGFPALKRRATSGQGNRRAALLLEVVVALAIMVMAMGMLSAQLMSGLKMTETAEEMTIASQLGDRILALIELDPNTLTRFFEERQVDGDFDVEVYKQYRGWFWRATVEKIPDNEELGRVTVEILHAAEAGRSASIEDARIVRTLHLLKANPAKIDLAKDFGVPQEQLDMLTAFLPIAGLDPAAINPLDIINQPPEVLIELIPVLLPLLEMFGVSGDLPADLSPDMLRGLLSGDLPGGTDLPDGVGGDPAVGEMIRSALGGALSEEELGALLSGVGETGGRGFGLPPGGPDDGRRGRTIEDLDRERDASNRRFDERSGGERKRGNR